MIEESTYKGCFQLACMYVVTCMHQNLLAVASYELRQTKRVDVSLSVVCISGACEPMPRHLVRDEVGQEWRSRPRAAFESDYIVPTARYMKYPDYRCRRSPIATVGKAI